MKFWQLVFICGCGDEPVSLENLLAREGWESFLNWLRKLDDIVDSQDRQILDSPVPDRLAENAMAICKFEFVVRNGSLRLAGNQEQGPGQLSTLEAFTRYGGDAIWEVLEYGSWPVERGLR